MDRVDKAHELGCFMGICMTKNVRHLFQRRRWKGWKFQDNQHQEEFLGDLWLIDSGHSQKGCTVCGKDTPCFFPFFYLFIALVWLNVEELGCGSPWTIGLQPFHQQQL